MQRKNLRPFSTMNLTEKQKVHCDDEGNPLSPLSLLTECQVTVWEWISTGTSPPAGARDTRTSCWRAPSPGALSTRDLTVSHLTTKPRFKSWIDFSHFRARVQGSPQAPEDYHKECHFREGWKKWNQSTFSSQLSSLRIIIIN